MCDIKYINDPKIIDQYFLKIEDKINEEIEKENKNKKNIYPIIEIDKKRKEKLKENKINLFGYVKDYLTTRNKIYYLINCSICNNYEYKNKEFLLSTSCDKICIKCNKRSTYTTEEMIYIFLQNGFIWLDKNEYESKDKKYKCMCIKCKDILFKSYSKIKYNCKKCLNIKKHTDEFIENELIKKGFKKIGKYINALTPFNAICSKNHNCTVLWNAWYRNVYNCYLCAYENSLGENHPKWNFNKKLYDNLRNKCTTYIKHYRNIIIKDDLKNINFLCKKFNCNKNDILNFKEKNKNWKNIEFAVDHIYPINAWINEGFIKTKEDITDEILLEINGLNNIQLLDPSDNYSKGHKYDKYEFYNYILQKEINKWQIK